MTPSSRTETRRFSRTARTARTACVLLILLGSTAGAQASGPSQHFVPLQRPDGVVWYRTQGAGPTILILSGGPGYSSDYLQAVYQHVGAHARAVLLDQRGTGHSVLPRMDSTTITVRKSVEDIEALRVALHVDRLIILGHSWGGELAMAYSAAYPQRVAGLILVGSAGPSQRSAATISQRLSHRLGAADRDSILRWSKLVPSPRGVEALSEISRLNRKAYMYDLRNETAAGRYMGPSSFSARVSRLMFQDLARTRFDVTPALRALAGGPREIPALVLYGEVDVIGSTTRPEIAAVFPRAQFHVLDKSGHYPWIEAPQEFYGDVDRFMSKLGNVCCRRDE